MGMTIKKRKDTALPSVFLHKVADVRGGVSVATSTLGGDFLKEGQVVSVPVNGISYVVKTGCVATAAESTATTITILKGHHFQVGDIVLAVEGGVAAAITAIDTTSSTTTDTLTIDAALGVALAVNDGIAEAAETSTSASALKYEPLAVIGTGVPVISGDNAITDAWIIGITKGNYLPAVVYDKLKGIVNYV